MNEAPQLQPPSQPALTPPQQPTTPINPPRDTTDIFGILSIVMIFLFLHLPGLILGLVGASKAKREKRSAVLSRIGWVANLVAMILTIITITLFALLIVFAKQHAEQVKSTGTSLGSSSSMTSDLDLREDTGDGYTLSVPSYYVEIDPEYRSTAADYAQGFDLSNEYIMVIKESGADFSSTMTVDGYADLSNRQYTDGSALTNASISTLSGIANPHRLSVKDYKVTGESDGVKVVYFIRYVKAADTFYQVIGWTSPSTLDAVQGSLSSSLESFNTK
ncbi:MAG: hypothetical protein WBP12_01140 [Candidatus Saccharimonas sp.]